MKKVVAYLFLVLFLVETSCALSVEIDIKSSFKVDEKIYFDYTITPFVDQDIVYVLQVNCPNAPAGLLEQKVISLKANEEVKETYYSFEVDNSTEPQECVASFILFEPYEQIFSEEFLIITNPGFSFDLILNKKVFIKNEEIYLDYESEISNIEISTELTYPKGDVESIELPSSIKAEQIGTYELEVIVSKEGYKTITKKEQFAVIEKDAVFRSASKCNADGICDDIENEQNCPQDCRSTITSAVENEHEELIGKQDFTEKKTPKNLLKKGIYTLVGLITLILIWHMIMKHKNKNIKA